MTTPSEIDKRITESLYAFISRRSYLIQLPYPATLSIEFTAAPDQPRLGAQPTVILSDGHKESMSGQGRAGS